MYSCNLASFVLYSTLRPEDVVSPLPQGRDVFGPEWARNAISAFSPETRFITDTPTIGQTIETYRGGDAVFVSDEISTMYFYGCSASRSRIGYMNLFYCPGFPTAHNSSFGATEIDTAMMWASIGNDGMPGIIRVFRETYASECSLSPQTVDANNMMGVFVVYGSIVGFTLLASFIVPFVCRMVPKIKEAFLHVVDRVKSCKNILPL